MLPAGSIIGILGGGQLGRMMAMAALQLGYRAIAYAPPGDNVAKDACADFFESGWRDREALAAFAAKCDVVTWEFENVPLAAVAAIPPALLACPARALEVAQDRLNEKSFIADLGGTSAPYARVESDDDFARALVSVGTPGILKTAREGYDGKGQWRIASAHEASGVGFPGRPCIYEGLVAFENEFSVILVRSTTGEVRFWDSTANHHEGGMLAQSVLPAGALIEAQVGQARELAAKTAQALGYVGVLTLEFFATAQGPVFNEMAPRVHNAGHWTIEGQHETCPIMSMPWALAWAMAAMSLKTAWGLVLLCSKAATITGLPLGATASRFASIDMRNIVGDAALTAYEILSEPGEPHLHLYGKREAREGRKMGHVTRVGHALA